MDKSKERAPQIINNSRVIWLFSGSAELTIPAVTICIYHILCTTLLMFPPIWYEWVKGITTDTSANSAEPQFAKAYFCDHIVVDCYFSRSVDFLNTSVLLTPVVCMMGVLSIVCWEMIIDGFAVEWKEAHIHSSNETLCECQQRSLNICCVERVAGWVWGPLKTPVTRRRSLLPSRVRGQDLIKEHPSSWFLAVHTVFPPGENKFKGCCQATKLLRTKPVLIPSISYCTVQNLKATYF